jgi:hypothetical protein
MAAMLTLGFLNGLWLLEGRFAEQSAPGLRSCKVHLERGTSDKEPQVTAPALAPPTPSPSNKRCATPRRTPPSQRVDYIVYTSAKTGVEQVSLNYCSRLTVELVLGII